MDTKLIELLLDRGIATPKDVAGYAAKFYGITFENFPLDGSSVQIVDKCETPELSQHRLTATELPGTPLYTHQGLLGQGGFEQEYQPFPSTDSFLTSTEGA